MKEDYAVVVEKKLTDGSNVFDIKLFDDKHPQNLVATIAMVSMKSAYELAHMLNGDTVIEVYKEK
jgi:hypothetical protein